MPSVRGLLECVLYASDLPAARAFYEGVLGLACVRDLDDLSLVFRIDAHTVLLIFNPEISEEPGRSVPSHGARGPGHLALRINAADFEAWIERMRSRGVAFEHVHAWDAGGRSIYVRDPADNSVELIDHDIWPREPAVR
ncbi:MAG: VOC family protein [Phycisphaerales bacterium]|jgi:catechol 2,3-dioxygenase-like lactoylglutathione lyase family enzyme|nr:VOC family protein [Phycisphaerales bacterium]